MAAALMVALAGFAGSVSPATATCNAGVALEQCGHDQGHPGLRTSCADPCRTFAAVPTAEPGLRACPVPLPGRRPAAAAFLAGVARDVPVPPPKGLG
jgi:hypothetical protein